MQRLAMAGLKVSNDCILLEAPETWGALGIPSGQRAGRRSRSSMMVSPVVPLSRHSARIRLLASVRTTTPPGSKRKNVLSPLLKNPHASCTLGVKLTENGSA
jgi:hypothetical protein